MQSHEPSALHGAALAGVYGGGRADTSKNHLHNVGRLNPQVVAGTEAKGTTANGTSFKVREVTVAQSLAPRDAELLYGGVSNRFGYVPIEC